MSYKKTKNEIFGSLLFLTDIARNEQILIDLLHQAGYENITKGKIRNWRKKDSGSFVPDFVLEVLLTFLFDLKKKNREKFSVLEVSEKKQD
ncbi:hypothetical protein [Gallibacterium anatis]|uniref:hypothetical protein n=1 Tax=Gallibacterium anatis TaxID=750 RepID=UPI0005319393|nr:hypothetical protein [Gallibacterium anatis]KGQ27513.1 hypothetical protein JP31_03550 [Gallibacterium anatis]KGQ28294.1 hypothetical protein JP27_03625 [Gallibacterium anatis]KGQ29748.1 hypothetical protein JP34_12265 [Gallibacterium anatis]